MPLSVGRAAAACLATWALLWALPASPAAAATACEPWHHRPPAVGAGDRLLPAGIAAGAVRATSATIVARTHGSGTVWAHYSAGPGCPEQTVGPLVTRRRHGFVAHLPLQGLTPGTVYRYVVEVEIDGRRGRSSPGWLTTEPRGDVPVRLAFSADLSNDPEDYGLLPLLTSMGADLFLSLGDWPYADWRPVARSLNDFRVKHAEMRAHEPLRALLRQLPVHGTWDDHEIMNDWDGRDAVDERDRVRFGMRVWKEWFPIGPGGPDGEIYRRHGWGDGVELFWLDCRSHRVANAKPDNPAKTMLGHEQVAWLLDGLSASEATFKLVMTSVPLDYGTTRKDYWGGGFTAERDHIVDEILARGIRDVVFLTADQHWLAVHHHPSGFKEFQVGPLAQFVRTPRRGPSWRLLALPVMNFGLVDYAPGDPPSLTFSAWAAGGDLLYVETVTAGRGRLTIAPASPRTRWRVTGAHTFAGVGPAVLPNAPPGAYTIVWSRPVPGFPPLPSAMGTLADGGELAFAEDASAVPGPSSLARFDDLALPAGWSRVADVGPDEAEGLEGPRSSTHDETLVLRAWPRTAAAFGVEYGRARDGSFHRLTLGGDPPHPRLEHIHGRDVRVLDQAPLAAVPQKDLVTVAIRFYHDQHEIWLDGRLVLAPPPGPVPDGPFRLFPWDPAAVHLDSLAHYPVTLPGR